MEVINPESSLVMTDEFNFFSTVPTLTPVVEWEKAGPAYSITSVEDSQIVEFYLPGSPLEFIKLSGIKLKVTGKIIKKADGSAISDANLAEISLASNVLHGQFSNLEIYLNEKIVQTANNLYHIQTHVQQLINADKQMIDTELALGGLYLDSPGGHDKLVDGENDAFKKRKELIKGSKEFTVVGPLIASLVEQHKLLIPGVSLRIKLVKNEPKHILLTGTGHGNKYEYKMTAVSLLVPKVKLSVPASLAVESTLRETPAAYQIERITNSYISIPTGTSSATFEGIYSGNLKFVNFFTFFQDLLCVL
jgi:hypothetical protein